MNDEDIRKQLQNAFATAEREPPSFDAVWAAANRQHERSRRRYRAFGGVAAAAAVVAVTVALWPAQRAELTGEYLIAEALLNSTSWSAPSDTLMPEHQFDIYQEIPFLIESTSSQEGSLL